MLSLFDELHQLLAIAAVLTAIATAFALGSRPWRLAAAIMTVEAFSWLAFSWALESTDTVVFSHAKSLVVAALLAAVVLTHRSLGLVFLLAFQLVAVFIHLSAWLERSIPADVNALVLNGVGWLMLATLFVGALSSVRRRSAAVDRR